MNSNEVVDTIWTRMGQEKNLVWEVKVALLLAALVSYFTMPMVVTFLVAVVWVLMMFTLQKPESSQPADEKLMQN